MENKKKTSIDLKNHLENIFELALQPKPEEMVNMVHAWGKRIKPKKK